MPEPPCQHETHADSGSKVRVTLDCQASLLTHRARGPAFHRGYTYRRANSSLAVKQPILGRDVPKHFGGREFSNGVETHTIQSVYYDVSLGLRYLRRMNLPPTRYACSLGRTCRTVCKRPMPAPTLTGA